MTSPSSSLLLQGSPDVTKLSGNFLLATRSPPKKVINFSDYILQKLTAQHEDIIVAPLCESGGRLACDAFVIIVDYNHCSQLVLQAKHAG